ncbi:SMEK domain-containing protein [Desulfurobacterium crinifex]
MTRGYYIGAVLDILSEISSKAKFRAKLGLYDIARHLEDFMLHFLNRVYSPKGYTFRNLNKEKVNYPGIDLIDEKNNIGVQITIRTDKKKIKKTIENVENTNITLNELWIISIAGWQTSKNIKLEIPFHCKVLDLNDIAKDILDLDFDILKDLYEFIEKESRQVKLELEVPDEMGMLSEDYRKYLEKIPHERMGSFENFLRYLRQDDDCKRKRDRKAIEQVFKAFAHKLKELPRVSRNFLGVALSSNPELWDGVVNIDLMILQRKLGISDKTLLEELQILEKYKFAWIDESTYLGKPYYILKVHFPLERELLPKRRNECIEVLIDYFTTLFVGFTQEYGIDIVNAITHLDFENF